MARKRILMWSPIVWVPDLDYFFAVEYHRALLSNIWIPLILIGVLVWLWKRRAPEMPFWQFVWRPGAPGALLLVTYFFLAHILMDIFAGGVVLLWPLTDTNFYLFYAIVVDTATNEPTMFAEGGTESGIPQVSETFTWVSAVDTAVVAFLVVAWLSWMWYRAIIRFRQDRPVAQAEATIVSAPIQKE